MRTYAAVLPLLLFAATISVSRADDIDMDDEDWEDTYDDGDEDVDSGGGNQYRDPNAPQQSASVSSPGYSVDDPTANHRNEGIKRDGAGDWKGAVEAFQAACRHNPKDPGSFNDLGVANMRVALKGIEVEKHLLASRAAYEMSAKLAGKVDENLQRNMDAIIDVEEWACTNQKICVGKFAGKGGGGKDVEGSVGGIAEAKDAAMKEAMGLDGGSGADQLKAFIRAQVNAVVGQLKSELDNHRMDFEILDTSLGGQIKALKNRVRKLEEQLAKVQAGGGVVGGGAAGEPAEEEEEEPMTEGEEKDEM